MAKHFPDNFLAFSRFAESIDTSVMDSFKRQLELYETTNSKMLKAMLPLADSPTLAFLKYGEEIRDSILPLIKASQDARHALDVVSPYWSEQSAAARSYLHDLSVASAMTLTEDYSNNLIGLDTISRDIFTQSTLFKEWRHSLSSLALFDSAHSHLFSDITANTDFLASFDIPHDEPEVIKLSEETEPEEEEESILDLPPTIGERLAEVRYIPLRLAQLIASDPSHLHQLTPRQFEEFTAELLDSLGFEDIKLTPQSRDGGKDIVATRRVNGIPIIVFVECKKYREDRKVGIDIARSLIGTLDSSQESGTLGIIATTSTFTAGAHNLIVGHSRLDGRDINGLSEWIQEVDWPKQ